MKAEHCECECYNSWALRMWMLRELIDVNMTFMRAEHCECEFYASYALRMWILCELSIANVKFMRAENYESQCEYYESWALQK